MASIYKRGRYWWISYRNSCGRRICQSLKVADKTTANRLKKHYEIEERRTALHGVTVESIYLQMYIRKYLAERKGQVAPATLTRYRQALESLLAFTGNVQIDSIKPSDIENWRRQYNQIRTVASANCLLRHIKASFSYAVEHRYLMESPAKYVRAIREVSKPLRILSEDEVQVLLTDISPAWERMIRVAMYTEQGQVSCVGSLRRMWI